MSIDNQPAFPVDGMYAADAIRQNTAGLTKREAFAMAALQGLLSNPAYFDYKMESLSGSAVEAADALLSFLNQTKS